MQKRAENTRNKLLDTGEKLFAEKGFAATPVDDIADASGVNKQRIYAYFGSKRGLFTECLRRMFAKAEIFQKEVLRNAESNPEKLTEILFTGFCGIYRKYPRFQRLLAWANLENSADTEMLIGVRAEENEAIRRIFECAVQKGYLKEMDYRVYLLSVMSLAYFTHSNAATLKKTIGLPETSQMADELKNIFAPSSVDGN